MERSPIDERRRRRGRAALFAGCLVLAALGLVFFQAQVLRGPAQAAPAPGNQPRAFAVPAPRGLILDRDGRVLAGSVPVYSLALLPGPPDSMRATLERLAPYLDLPSPALAALLERKQRDRHQVLVVAEDTPPDVVARIEERRSRFPGLVIDARPRRSYPAGRAAAHLVGFVGAAEPEGRGLGWAAGHGADQPGGRSGVEAQYERELAGRGGLRYVEVDRYGRVVGPLTSAPTVRPVPGQDVRLSVDLTLQQRLAELIPDTVRGGVVMIEPASGAVIALYSSPSYDPNDLVRHPDTGALAGLRADPAEPLRDRAMGTIYGTGPTWQLATAAIALGLGVASGDGTMPLACRGGMSYGERYLRCRDPRGHGPLTLVEALRSSCDVYFYQLGVQLGLGRMATEGTRLGFGRITGVDLPGEQAGGIGVDLADAAASDAGLGAALLAAGAGPTTASPLQLAHLFATLTGRAGVPAPRVRLVSSSEPVPVGDPTPGLGGDARAWLRAGLRRTAEAGAPTPAAIPEHWAWLGAGGPTEVSNGTGHAWFVGLAGPENGAPELVVAVVIEGSGPDPAAIAAGAVDHRLRPDPRVAAPADR